MNRPISSFRWLERGQALLLVMGALYFLAIGELSPHPLPGLRLLALSVLTAGVMIAFRSTRLRRVTAVLCILGVSFGLAGGVDIVSASRPSPQARR